MQDNNNTAIVIIRATLETETKLYAKLVPKFIKKRLFRHLCYF